MNASAGALALESQPFGWLRSAPAPARRALLAASVGWMFDGFDVMIYSMVLTARAGRLRHLEDDRRRPRIADAAGVGRRRRAVRDDRRSPRPPDRHHQQRADVLAVHRGVRACADRLAAGRSAGSSSGSAWAAPGRPARRSSPRAGRIAIAARPSASCRAPGRSATVGRRRSSAIVLPRYGWRAMFFIGALPALAAFWIHGSRGRAGDLDRCAQPAAAASLGVIFSPRLSASDARRSWP